MVRVTHDCVYFQREARYRDAATQTEPGRSLRSIGRGAASPYAVESLPPRGRGRALYASIAASYAFETFMKMQ